MKRKLFSILPMIGVALLAMVSIEAHAAAVQASALLPNITAEGITQALAAAGALGVAGSTVSSHVENHATSKWFRIMTEGPTVDGRTIERAWIEQMAATYDPKVYGARINLEHFKGIDPQGLFKAYGDVLALKSEEVDGKLALFAQIAPTPALVALVKDKQKIYTSGEVHPSFADSKQAYLIGLAVTDNPASLGTEALEFSARNTANLFSAACETAFELETPAVDPVKAVFTKVAGILGKFTKQQKTEADARFADLTEAVELLANHGKEQAEAFATQGAALTELQGKYTQLEKDHADLVAKLSATPDTTQRPANTGGDSTIKTDC